MRQIVIIALMLLLTWACAPETISLDELKKYPMNPEHGLIQKVEKGNTVLEMYYKPKELIIAQELSAHPTDEERKSLARTYDSLDYFVLRLSRNGQEIENGYASDPAQFTDVLSYLSYYIGPDIYMIQQQDTVPILDAVYARTFGATDATNVMAVFKSKLTSHSGPTTIYFNDTRFGTGLNEFVFDSDRIKSIPTLKFK